MKINVNDWVSVKLTQTGINILKRQHDESLPVGWYRDFSINIDECGYTKMQLSVLMSKLGPQYRDAFEDIIEVHKNWFDRTNSWLDLSKPLPSPILQNILICDVMEMGAVAMVDLSRREARLANGNVLDVNIAYTHVQRHLNRGDIAEIQYANCKTYLCKQMVDRA